MALVIKVNGQQTQVRPQNGQHFELPELYRLLECRVIDIIELADGRLMVIDDEGKLSEDWQINLPASELYRKGRMSTREFREHLKHMAEENDLFIIDSTTDSLDVIAGDVLIATKEEIN